MKYVRTKDTIFEVVDETDIIYLVKAKGNPNNIYSKSKCNTEVINQADTIEKLCDATFYVRKNQKPEVYLDTEIIKYRKPYKLFDEQVYLAIFTDKGLIYVAKLNEKGCLELL